MFDFSFISRFDEMSFRAQMAAQGAGKLNGSSGALSRLGGAGLSGLGTDWYTALQNAAGSQYGNTSAITSGSSVGNHIPYSQMDQKTFLSFMEAAQRTGAAPELTQIAAISKAYSTGKADAVNFADAFPRYDVTTHVGNADISDANWQRNDFPFWKYYDKNASADCLNDWKPLGAEPSMSDASVQRGLSTIGSGKMAVIIPEKLQEKMDADPVYAREVMAKVQKWKEDYDNWDNATALSLGMNPMEHQASKSYCINLDEDGNVKQFVVSSPGRVTKSGDDSNKTEREQRVKKQREYEKMLYERNVQQRLLQEHLMQSRLLQTQLPGQNNLFSNNFGMYAGLFGGGIFF